MSHTRQGQFVVVEGMDGSGKSECTKVLAEALRQLGLDVVQTYEVGGTPIGKQLRALCFRSRQDDGEIVDPLARMLMIYASRLQHLTNVVYPATAAGKTVVSDRYVPSTRVYQGAIDGMADLMDQLDFTPGLDKLAEAADIYVYLDVDPEVAYRRGKARENVDNDVYKNDLNKAFRIKDAYDAEMRKYMGRADVLFYRVDANQPLVEVQKSMVYVAREIILASRRMPMVGAEPEHAPVESSVEKTQWNERHVPRSAAMQARTGRL